MLYASCFFFPRLILSLSKEQGKWPRQRSMGGKASRLRPGLIMTLLVALAACTAKAPQVTPWLDSNPEHLSQWGMVSVRGGALVLGQGGIPYDLNTPLFTDAAHKLRVLWMPPGKSAQYRTGAALDFPVGTVIAKTFYYPKNSDGVLLRNTDYAADFAGQGLNMRHVHLIETRILVHRPRGWAALPYIWDAAQKDAVLERTGGLQRLHVQKPDGSGQDFAYIVPNANQCAGCHAANAISRAISPLGPKARHLNKPYAYAGGAQNQLVHLARLGKLSGFPGPDKAPRNADWLDKSAPLNARARAYLDINCGHCHNPSGAASTSAFYLDQAGHDYPPGNSGVCKPPVAAGQGTGGHLFDIVPGDAADSIVIFRMKSTNPGVMMPELGRSTVDEDGVKLISAWINAMPGACATG